MPDPSDRSSNDLPSVVENDADAREALAALLKAPMGIVPAEPADRTPDGAAWKV